MTGTNGMKVGIAAIDITPPVGVTMVGYKPRISTGLGHTLRAEAMVFDGSGGRWVLITSDTIGYPSWYAGRICQAVAAETGIATEAIIVSGTHTHSGPATTTFGMDDRNELDKQYLDALPGKLAELVKKACDNVKPATLETARTSAPDLAHNRRIEVDGDEWSNEWEDHEGNHPGNYDPAIFLTAVRREDGSCDALLVNYGCHPVVLGPQSLDISADYVGYIKDRIEAKAAVGTVMFALAGGGNINPRVCIQEGAEYPKHMGERVADIVLQALGELKAVEGGKVTSHQQKWEMVRTRDAYKRKGSPGSNAGDTIETTMTAARAGDVGVISIPGEMFTEFNAMLRKASGLPVTIVATLANDYIGYLPTDEGQKQGAYETNMAPCEGIEQSLMECAGKAFGEIA